MTEMVEQNPKMFRSGVSLFEVCSYFRASEYKSTRSHTYGKAEKSP